MNNYIKITILIALGYVFYLPALIFVEQATGSDQVCTSFQVDPGVTLMTNISLYYPMDETSGTRHDFINSDSSNDLTDNNTVGSTTGQVGTAADFEADNADEDLTANDTPENSLGVDADFSYFWWFYRESDQGAEECMMAKDDSGGNEIRNCIGTVTPDRANCSSASAQSAVWGSDATTGQWFSIACTFELSANEIEIIIDNGTPVNNDSATVAGEDGDGVLQIGSTDGASSNSNWDGRIDEWGFWKDKILTAQELSDLHNGGSGQTCVTSAATGRGHRLIYNY